MWRGDPGVFFSSSRLSGFYSLLTENRMSTPFTDCLLLCCVKNVALFSRELFVVMQSYHLSLQDQWWLDSTNHLWKTAFYRPRQSDKNNSILQQPLSSSCLGINRFLKLNVLQEEGTGWSWNEGNPKYLQNDDRRQVLLIGVSNTIRWALQRLCVLFF